MQQNNSSFIGIGLAGIAAAALIHPPVLCPEEIQQHLIHPVSRALAKCKHPALFGDVPIGRAAALCQAAIAFWQRVPYLQQLGLVNALHVQE